ncbi:flagellar hook-basal body protein [Helicobacter sp. 13S00401-1]|uniref:flagellar hook-basal body complex protein n=1 Tax=Helicobacter sp. 13S00401-1 TaxID=1905758 RepID=UPI000BA61834|nr:flagellar hook-basal body complex protein [Helicobacter sp. 13S00401-1]PAF51916.1 flagellar hook-basal body protein [Helicobacter sp. 13S00401-1]
MNDTLLNAVSGIKTHQFGLDSISNNIANVNTNGYKANTPEFKTLFSKNLDSMNSSTVTNNDFSYGVTGGSNNIDTKLGDLRKVDNPTSVAFTGKGWLVVGKDKNGTFEIDKNGYKESSPDQNFFTRNGDFSMDSDGYLVNAQGYYLYGVNLGKIQNDTFKASQDPEGDLKKLATGVMKPIAIPPDISYAPVETTKVNLNVNLNRTKDFKSIVSAYTEGHVFNEARFFNQDLNAIANTDKDMLNPSAYSDGTITITDKNGQVKEYKYSYGDGTSSENKFHTIGQLQYLIQRDTGLDLDLSRDAKGAIYPKSTLVLKNSDDDTLKIKVAGKLFERLGLNGSNDSFAKGESILGTNLNVPTYSTTTEVYDSTGKKYALRTDYLLVNSGDDTGPQTTPETWNTRSAIYEFGGDHMMVSKNFTEGVISFDKNGKAITKDLDIPFLDNKDIVLTLKDSSNKAYADSRINKTTQDGKERGELRDIRINDEGIISLSFSNGQNEAIGRVGLAMFANDQGLKKVGGNLFALDPRTINGQQGLASGDPKLVWDEDSNLKNGKIMQGYVETSNVDLSTALTDLILMQRGYSMNAKAFTTGDDLTKEAINLKR